MPSARLARAIAAVGLALVALGCASARSPECSPAEWPAVSELVYFGTTKPSGTVTTAEWADFLATSVTPRFPRGLTVWHASGQWKGSGGLVRQPSYVLNIVHAGDEPSDAALRAIIAEYKSRFAQEAVLRVRSWSCASL